MKLVEAQVSHFKNFLDSGTVEIQPDITALVGKNESGKSAFLQALTRLHPAHEGRKFAAASQYPAWLEKRHRRDGIDLEEVQPITCVFVVESADKKAFEDRFGPGTLLVDKMCVARAYSNKRSYTLEVDELACIKHLTSTAGLSAESAAGVNSIAGLPALVARLAATGDPAQVAVSAKLEAARKEVMGRSETLMQAAINFVDERLLPQFFYFDEYSGLKGTIKIKEVLNKNIEDLDDEDRTARALLEQAGADKDYLLNPDYDTRKRELENVANSITHEVLEYWSTNPELRVQIDITQRNVAVGNGQQTVLDELKLRLWDDRHLLSLPFDERSTGFRWFFSFLAAFSEYEQEEAGSIIILLDEPGVGLHARAQEDFLRFIEERLVKKCQVIYSTHSPFMIQPNHLERARLVEDKGRDTGSKVTADVLATDKDTLFPLQGALGYELAQHLFVAPHNLVVEGTSDYTYLLTLSDFLKESSRQGLDDRWSIVPVGGADLVPSFVALLGTHLEVTVVIDSRKEGNQRLMRLADQGILNRTRIITIGELIGAKLADVEDLFGVDEYLELYNAAFGAKLSAKALVGKDPIVARIARHVGAERFDHGKPAGNLLKRRNEFLGRLSADTLTRFETLFARINATLET